MGIATYPEAFPASPVPYWSYLGNGSGQYASQKTVMSYDNGWNHNGSNQGNVGNEFMTIKHRYFDSGVLSPASTRIYNGPYYYEGWRTLDWDGQFMPSAHSDNLSLMAKGATAIARCIPTSPVSDVSTALGELMRDGIPDVPLINSWKDRTKSASQKVGGEYLNVEFGWKPMINDIQSLSAAVTKSHKILDDYRRGSGKQIRRQYSFPTETSQNIVIRDNIYPYIPTSTTWFYVNPGRLTRTETIQKDTWFKGAFTYYLEPGEDRMSQLARASQEAKKLYGVRFTPDVLWNLAPWSWAADWVSNAGDVISNVSAFNSDGLVMRYGYLMEHTIATREYRLEGYRLYGDSAPRTDIATFVTETKRRVPATPFGFGLDLGALSGRQQAIIAALGLSRNARVAR